MCKSDLCWVLIDCDCTRINVSVKFIRRDSFFLCAPHSAKPPERPQSKLFIRSNIKWHQMEHETTAGEFQKFNRHFVVAAASCHSCQHTRESSAHIRFRVFRGYKTSRASQKYGALAFWIAKSLLPIRTASSFDAHDHFLMQIYIYIA